MALCPYSPLLNVYNLFNFRGCHFTLFTSQKYLIIGLLSAIPPGTTFQNKTEKKERQNNTTSFLRQGVEKLHDTQTYLCDQMIM